MYGASDGSLAAAAGPLKSQTMRFNDSYGTGGCAKKKIKKKVEHIRKLATKSSAGRSELCLQSREIKLETEGHR